MKINRQFQDLHLAKPSADWVLKQHVERDICLLYHQLANYSYIMGDLYYGDVFGLPYWEYLDFPGLEPADREFVRDGCLVMLLAMASECIDGTGSYLVPHVPACIAALDLLKSSDHDTERLARILRLALELVQRGDPETPELADAYKWVHERFVRPYFSARAEEFRTNPYYGGGAS